MIWQLFYKNKPSCFQSMCRRVCHSPPCTLSSTPGHTGPATATASPTATWSGHCPREKSVVSTRLCRRPPCSCWVWRAVFDALLLPRLQPSWSSKTHWKRGNTLLVNWSICHLLINGSALGLSGNKGSLLRSIDIAFVFYLGEGESRHWDKSSLLSI